MAPTAGDLPARLQGVKGYLSRPFPFGVSAQAPGAPGLPDTVNVAVYAPGLQEMDIWFVDPFGRLLSVPLFDETYNIFHATIEQLRPGARYAFWERGAELPQDGQLLLDPWGRAIEQDDAGVYWSVYVESDFDWGDDVRPHVPWRDTVIYETHVKGQTMLHPDIPEELRGTYAGLAHPVMVKHLQDIGVTAVELLPIHFHLDEPHLQELGLPNYWGYNTLGFFAPHTGYATAAAQAAGPKAVQDEIKGMVKALHSAGIEVLMDVVFNHTAEGGRGQQAYSWRGLGDTQYYRHDADGRYFDTTGCGNTLDFNQPTVVRMALDSLRHWVEDYHIDGFRFDLAVALSRDTHNHFNPQHPFLVALTSDSVLTGTKLIAEPWDVSMGGWQTGRFPQPFHDWNDHFRDIVREFWVSDHGSLLAGGQGSSVARLASCLAGSRDLFAPSGRGALSSINFITAHDGFTLRDLVSYDRKHNEDNGEDNRDGHSHNRSYNHGLEGATADEELMARRRQTASNVMATLLLSLGVPMLTAGDELGKTQEGNNNAYCQDNYRTWLDWTLSEDQRAMLKNTKALMRLRKEFMAGQPHTFPTQDASSYMHWFNADGVPMRREEWTRPETRLVQMLLGSPEGKIDGLAVFNGGTEPVRIRMPDPDILRALRPQDRQGTTFKLQFSTAEGSLRRRGAALKAGEPELIEAHSVTVYRA
ncbi:glycogen debranching protein GlgX [Arthrobacter ginkgonis]|uniref:Glycogen debranching protein GlgX n=1 Tax=Arthrobacter ginkgonis TaxID=1630594 RepID=A0ABP7C6K8_9MICC